MTTIRLFFANLKLTILKALIEREIRNSIPQKSGMRNGKHSFDSHDDLWTAVHQKHTDVQLLIKAIEDKAGMMERPRALAFLFIVYRELNTKLELYSDLLDRESPNQNKIPACA